MSVFLVQCFRFSLFFFWETVLCRTSRRHRTEAKLSILPIRKRLKLDGFVPSLQKTVEGFQERMPYAEATRRRVEMEYSGTSVKIKVRLIKARLGFSLTTFLPMPSMPFLPPPQVRIKIFCFICS